MDAFYDRLRLRAATIDELLSDAFTALPGADADADLAARRLAAWCRSSAAGDEALFARRLARDGLTVDRLRERFAAVRPERRRSAPAWLGDAAWIEAALQGPTDSAKPITPLRRRTVAHSKSCSCRSSRKPRQRLWQGLDEAASHNLTPKPRAPAFRSACSANYPPFPPRPSTSASPKRAVPMQARYDQFVADMQSGGFRRLFEDKPVLLRLLATLARQWIDTSREFVGRLAADLPAIRRDLLQRRRRQPRRRDRTRPLRSAQWRPLGSHRALRRRRAHRVQAEGSAARRRLARLDRAIEPRRPSRRAESRSPDRARRLWLDRIHRSCGMRRSNGLRAVFPARRRMAGAVSRLRRDRHASGKHDRMRRSSGADRSGNDPSAVAPTSTRLPEPEGEAFNAAMDIIANSVMTVGLLPAYGRSVDNNVFAMGGMTADWGARTVIKWNAINSDAMRPAKAQEPGADQYQPAASRRPLRQIRRPYREFCLGLCRLCEVFCGGRPAAQVRRCCSTALPACRCARSSARPGSITCCCSA